MSGASRSLKTRLLIFLYGNGNLAGCALALLGPALLFAGVIGPGWGWITAGLYGLGWVAGSASARAPDIERSIADTLTVEETLEHFDDLVKRVSPQLTPEMHQHLSSVRASVAAVLPRLVGARSHEADLFTVRETVLRYLPETLANYVALPPAFRNSHGLEGGKTARKLLADQLEILDDKLKEIVDNIVKSDAQALLANGRFLEAKFRQPDFLVH